MLIKKSRWPVIAITILACLMLFIGQYVESATNSPVGLKLPDSVSPPTSTARYFPNTILITQDNKKVRFYDDLVKGKVVVINLMYTTCADICPITTGSLLQVQKALGDRIGRDVFLYSITLDPERDTPEMLKTYAKNIGAKKGWYFLTGEFEDIERLRRKLGLYDPDPVIDADKTQHGGLFIYGNEATGRWATIPGFAKSESIVKALLKVMTPVQKIKG